ncbi:MAG: DUF6259 domain-containing protein [Victivallales bacterium]|jgi:hypothetical protein|nr:DUF6259 domain-containing protein [Victivallales bacterium]
MMIYQDNGVCRIDGGSVGWQLSCFYRDRQTHELLSSKDAVDFRRLNGGYVWKNSCGLEVFLEKDDNENEWHFRFERCPANLEVREIQFPHFSELDEHERFLLPESTGLLTGPVKEWQEGVEHERSIYPFQMTVCFGRQKNFLVMLQDPRHYCKSIRIAKKGGEATVATVFFVPQAGEHLTAYKVPFAYKLLEFTGTWFDAAEIYRQWARQQPSYLAAKKRKQPLSDIAMWFWNRGDSDQVADPVIEFARRSGLPLALDWYWWHHNPYDTDYPFFWPPRESIEVFRDKIAQLHKRQIFTQVYTNGMTWDMDGYGWEQGGLQSAIIKESGEVQNFPYNNFNHHRLAFLCGESVPFQQEMIRQAKEISRQGMDGMYLDQLGSVTNYIPCWNPTHRHTKGGGDYHYRGYRNFLTELKRQCPTLSLSTEDCNEEYLDLFDSMIVLCHSIERCGYESFAGEFVPVFQAVYHGCSALFGTYAIPDGIPPWDPLWPKEERWSQEEEQPWEVLYADQFYLEIARNLVYGLQPTVNSLRMEHFENPRFAPIIEFLLQVAAFYYAHRQWLFDGEMLNPGRLETADVEIPIMVRTVYTKQADFCSYTKKFPAILHACYQRSDGQKALFLCNYTGEKQSYRFGSLQGSLEARSFACIFLS